MEYNGSAIIAMVGKNCVAIAADKRFGVQALTLATDFQKIFTVNDSIMIGLPGLASDVETLYCSINNRHEKFRFKVNMYKLNEGREIAPKTFAHLVSSTLYEHRYHSLIRFGPYFVEPIVAGLNKDGSPFIASMDLIGCINFAKDFVVAGTASDMMYGMCESLWEPGLEPEELFETISQALLNAVDRDASSGSGGVVHVITPTKVITRHLRGRMD